MTTYELYTKSAYTCSKSITRAYSTSFSLASSLLAQPMRNAIYAIYGFVRLADEIVDSFHDTPQEDLLDAFERDTKEAIARGVSLNPILHAFQNCVREYQIEYPLIDAFLASMRADLRKKAHTTHSFSSYVYGSAEVVGLMCLRVFVQGNAALYDTLTPSARALGNAFQQVNFLRDIGSDFAILGRSYFPEVDPARFTQESRAQVEREIESAFSEALSGIRKLPNGARLGVYVAYRYYVALFSKLRQVPTEELLMKRVRIPGITKFSLLLRSWVRYRMNALASSLLPIFLVFSVSCQAIADSPAPTDLRSQYYAAVDDSGLADAFYERMSSLPPNASPREIGFKGLAAMILSKHAYNPVNKITYFREGRALLDQAIASQPENVELRFFRYTVQDNAPFFLDYSSEMKEDRKVMDAFLIDPSRVSQERDLADRITSYLREQ